MTFVTIFFSFWMAMKGADVSALFSDGLHQGVCFVINKEALLSGCAE
jgi:hypothetical protein